MSPRLEVKKGTTYAPKTYACWEDAAKAALDKCPRSTGGDHAHLINIENWLTEARGYLVSNPEQATNLFRSIVDDALEGAPKPTTVAPSKRRPTQERHLLETIASKQHDYGHDNILWADIDGVIVRMHDKIARIKNLQERAVAIAESDDYAMDNASARNESLYDSWLDIAGYGVIALMLLNGTFTLDLRADQKSQPDPNGDEDYGRGQHSAFDAGNAILENLSPPLEEYEVQRRYGFEDVEAPDDDSQARAEDDGYDEHDDPTFWHYDLDNQEVIVGIHLDGFVDDIPRAVVGVRTNSDEWARCAYFTYDELNDVLGYLDEVCDFLRHTDRARELAKRLVIADV